MSGRQKTTVRNTASRIGITCGDPAGIGPELIIRISEHFKEDRAYILYSPQEVINRAQSLLGIKLDLEVVSGAEEAGEEGIYLVDIDSSGDPFTPSISSGRVAISALARAVSEAIRGDIDGLLTMPINKFWAKRAGFAFEGQTEFLARATNTEDFAMMMHSEKIRVVLLTTHLPLHEAIKHVRKQKIVEKGILISKEFRRLFGTEPKIKIVGLNPHAGEGGDIGREDIEEIKPAVEELRAKGIEAEGPLSPDTAFLKVENHDVYLCMYHDQGLIPFKLLAFEEGVNLTIGLPFPRTSPDHGTAYDIAWRGTANPKSSLKALELLEGLIENLRNG